ncbi:NERD domain-containing protein [Peribacillus saganii]|uniref:NERD domain-containing protein n=1 Tax=Peribacillus saganii TaxID=2303992 RepID=A0A372LLG0_9BACI|nr:NERD domain-containing protein [Peribacillus saganii]RFU67086.1 NERD domain-containing protein [Peribacillus saganii]
MIVKGREIPLYTKKLEALLRRTPQNHHKLPLIKESLAKSVAGNKGEHSIDYPLTFLPEEKFIIFHDLRLLHKKYYFQMDTLILCKNFMLILEVKNYAGTLFFDQNFHQLIRTYDGREEAFPSPLIQIERHEHQLKYWMSVYKLPELPVLSLVVLSSPYTRITNSPVNKQLYEKLIHSDYLPQRISQFTTDHPNEVLSDKDIKKIIRQLNKEHTPADRPILERFNMSGDDLLKGVHCLQCGHLPVTRVFGNWFCPQCSKKCKNAHLSSLRDYSLLISSTITNRQACEFLQISSPSVTKRILSSMDGILTGSKKGRSYFLPYSE